MPKFIVDIALDGCDSEEQHERECEEFIKYQLRHPAGSISIEKIQSKYRCTAACEFCPENPEEWCALALVPDSVRIKSTKKESACEFCGDNPCGKSWCPYTKGYK